MTFSSEVEGMLADVIDADGGVANASVRLGYPSLGANNFTTGARPTTYTEVAGIAAVKEQRPTVDGAGRQLVEFRYRVARAALEALGITGVPAAGWHLTELVDAPGVDIGPLEVCAVDASCGGRCYELVCRTLDKVKA